MESSWDFLPEVPSSFKDTTSNSYGIKSKISKLKVEIENSEIDLNLKRSREPIDVSLAAEKTSLKINYLINPSLNIYFANSKTDAEKQKFNCYDFNGLVIGTCPIAGLNISSSNPKYDELGDNLIQITGKTESRMLGFHRNITNNFIDMVDISFQQTKHNFNWLTPIEDISSSIILDIEIGNSTLGNEINNVLQSLPQRSMWKTNQLNLGIQRTLKIKKGFTIVPSLDIKILDYKDYKNINDIPNSNFRFSLSFNYIYKNIGISLFGDYYHNNLLGFEHITFTQRTEKYFEDPYGEIGLKLTLNF